MNHKTFLHYIHNTDNRTWYYDEYDDFETNWRKRFELFFLSHGKRLSNLKDFCHKVDHFVQGLDMLSTGRLSQTLIHPRRMLKLLRKVVCDVTTEQFPICTFVY